MSGDRSTPPITLADVRAAANRIAPHVRRTPTVSWTCRAAIPLGEARVTLKLEHLQVSGSFKARGAVNRLASLSPSAIAAGVVTASGGNHGLGVAWAAARFGVRATVFLPDSAPRSTEQRLVAMGAATVRGGAAWDDAWRLAERHARACGQLLVHPFEDLAVIAGQATVGLELHEDAPDLDAVIVAVGGGGLIGGVALAMKALRPSLRVIGVEPTGAATMQAALAAGEVVELTEIHTIAGTLAPRAVGPTTLGLARALLDDLVLVSDDELRMAQRLLWDELRLLVEPAGAAAVAALVNGHLHLGAAQHVGVVLCGANLDVEKLLPSENGERIAV